MALNFRQMLCVALALCLGTAAAAQAQTGTQDKDKPTTGSDIIVNGRKPLDSHETVRLVKQMSAPVQQQLAKFSDPVCPLVIGFAPAMEQSIESRLRQIAAAVGAEVSKKPCDANVMVIANAEPGKMVSTLQTKLPHLFDGVEAGDIKKLVASDAPVRSWTSTAAVNEDGHVAWSAQGDYSGSPPTLQVRSASIINPTIKYVIASTVIVLDANYLPGRTPLQVSDYVAMRTLARTRPMTGNVNTILTLFDPDAVSNPAGLTQTDFDYLHGLYAIPGNRDGIYQLAGIAKAVEKGAKKGSQGR